MKDNHKPRSSRRGPFAELGQGASGEARRTAAVILEVLAGVRTPLAAAEVLSVSLPRYYVLENRAVQAVVLACEPRAVGRQATAESALASLRRECEQLRRDCARQQALVRAAQRSMGLTPPPAPAPKPAKNGRARRSRRPTVRALRAVERLQTQEQEPLSAAAAASKSE